LGDQADKPLYIETSPERGYQFVAPQKRQRSRRALLHLGHHPSLAIVPDHIEDLCERLAETQQFIKPAGIHELAGGVTSAHYEFRHSKATIREDGAHGLGTSLKYPQFRGKKLPRP
jgi:hypothetical protein